MRSTPEALLGTEAMGAALSLAPLLTDKDDGTMQVVQSFVGKLPAAAFLVVREKLSENGSKRQPSAYAVAELKRMVEERAYAR